MIINVIFAGATIERNTVWQDNFTLFSDSAEKSPCAALPRTNLGNAYIERENIEEAITQFKIATSLMPAAVEPHAKLGFAYMAQGKIDEALHEYGLVLHLNPEFPMAQQYYDYLYRLKNAPMINRNTGK